MNNERDYVSRLLQSNMDKKDMIIIQDLFRRIKEDNSSFLRKLLKDDYKEIQDLLDKLKDIVDSSHRSHSLDTIDFLDYKFTDAELKNEYEAFAYLLVIETHLRDLIHTKMSLTFGDNWPKTQLSPKTHKKWQKTKENRAQPEHLKDIDFADFDHYTEIIFASENWEPVFEAMFKPIFNNQKCLRDTLQWLKGVRNTIMHARSIQEAELDLLRSKAKRIIQVRIQDE